MKRIFLLSLTLLLASVGWAQQSRIFRSEFLTYDRREAGTADKREGTNGYLAFAPELISQSEQELVWAQRYDVDAAMNDYNIFLHLENVATAFTLQVNGVDVVCEEDFYTPTDLLLSPYLRQGANDVVLRLRLSRLPHLMAGVKFQSDKLFANSYFFIQRRLSIRDFDITLRPDSTRSFGVLDMRLVLANDFNFEEPINVGYDLYDPSGKIVELNSREFILDGRALDTVNIAPYVYHTNNFKWDGTKAPLYTLTLYIKRSGMMWEYIPLKVGFSDVEWRDGKLFSFGKALASKPVMYEATTDRKVALERLRTHKKQGNRLLLLPYPQPKWFYDMCDREGVMVIDQAALSALTDDNRSVGGTPANNPQLADEFLLRVKKMYYRSRNHTCVVGFSLAGDATGNGYNLYKAYEWLKSVEQRRPVFYFGSDGEWNSDKWSW